MCWRRRYEFPPSVCEACWRVPAVAQLSRARPCTPDGVYAGLDVDRPLFVVSCGSAQVSAEGSLRAMLNGLRESRARTADLLNHPGLRPLEVSVAAGGAPAAGRGAKGPVKVKLPGV
jgi:hypothetical protein